MCSVTLTASDVHWKPIEPTASLDARRYRPIERISLPLKEIFAVHHTDHDTRAAVVRGKSSFSIWIIRRTNKYHWNHEKIVFHSPDVNIVSQWLAKMKDLISQPGLKRPKSLLVFLNPISGKRRAVRVFHEKIAPLFQLANIKTQVIQTQRRYHARDVLQKYDLEGVDGVVSVGGDGLFAEIVDGLLTRTMSDAGTDYITSDTTLMQPKWTIGIIPAGSTDTVSYSSQGINDPVTSALHIIVGDCMALDVGTVFHNQQFLRFCISFLGYGYYGDCILDSEQNRWMGPKRYDWEGFKKVVANRSYTGEISFLLSGDEQSHPRDQTVCSAGCAVCRAKSSALPDDMLPQRPPSYSLDGANSRWQTVRGRFAALNSFLMSCRCRYAPEGPAPAAHFGNGCSDLVIVHDCSRFQYVKHLYRCTIPDADQFDFPFIQAFRVTRFKFRPIEDDEQPLDSPTRDAERLHVRGGSTSVWNCDGEVIDEPNVEFIIHPQLIRLYARGIEDENKDESRCCNCSPFSHAATV